MRKTGAALQVLGQARFQGVLKLDSGHFGYLGLILQKLERYLGRLFQKIWPWGWVNMGIGLLWKKGIYIWWASLVTTTTFAWQPSLSLVSFIFGINNIIMRNVDITFTVMVLSNPSTSSNLGVAMPAFAIRTSIRSRLWARLQNAFTLLKDTKSTCQTSTTPVRLVVSSMETFAFEPFSALRQARITSAALSRVKCLAASRPRPQLEPLAVRFQHRDQRW